jgi:hypothetical protein
VLPQKSHELARNLIHAEREGRMAALDMDIQSIYNERIQHGMLDSTATVQHIGQLCAHELAVRARLVETHLFRVVSETLTEYPTDLAEALKAEAKLYVHEDALNLRDYAQQKAESAYAGHALLAREQVEMEENRVMTRMVANIDFFMARLDAGMAQRRAPPSGPVINIQGPVGAIQTGAGAVANISQSLSSEDLSKLRLVLEDLAARLDSFAELSTVKRAELKDVVNEAIRDASATRPNSTKLAGALMGIASTVQGIASGQGAYLALRDMLLLLGY